MKLLTITTLYPNANDPKHGIFIHTRLKHLLADYPEFSAKVIAPVPWFPFSHSVFGQYAKYANVPKQEVIDGIEVYHPRYLVLPKIGMYLTPFFLKRAIKRQFDTLRLRYEPDLIDGHYYFPDGVAIADVAKQAGLPFTCTARGTDINLVPQYERAKAMILQVCDEAAHNLTVCQALKDEMVALGVDEQRVGVYRNGVDLALFSASTEEQQQAAKKARGIHHSLILSVGWLIERKGHHLIIDALVSIPDATLVIAGDGPDKMSLLARAAKLGVADRVKLIGSVAQSELNQWFQAADVSVLASSREGWANVLLESMASGTAVVATKVWGTPEVVASREAGVLVERNAQAIAEGVNTLLANKPSRASTRAYAERFSWQETTAGLRKLFNDLLQQTKR